MGSQRRMAAFTDQLVDPLIADTYGEEVVRMREHIFTRALGMASQVSNSLIHRSSAADALPQDEPVPTPDGKLHRQIGQAPGPREQNYGPVRQGSGVGLDGELVKYVVGSVASASGSMASASGSAALAAGGYLYNQGRERLKVSNGIHNAKVIGGVAVSGAGAAVSGAGLVFNVAAGTARATASTGSAIINWTADTIVNPALAEHAYRQSVAQAEREIKNREYMTAQAKLAEQAHIMQEVRRIADEEENRRNAEIAVAMDRARQQEADFQSARSEAMSVVSRTHGSGRQGNLQRAAQSRQPAREYGIRNEATVEGLGRRLARGISNLF